MSSDAYNYCKLCRINHTLQRKHLFTKKHKQRLKTVLQKYGQKIKDCRPYLNDPVLQEGNFEPNADFWCHCCDKSFKKHVTDHFKTILYGGVIEHLASEDHWTFTEQFFEENGADKKFKISFIVSQTDINLYKSKLEPLVDVYNCRKEKKTEAIAKQITSQELSRKLVAGASSSTGPSVAPDVLKYRTVKNRFGIVQNPSGYHDNVRVWKGGIVKYKNNSNQNCPFMYPCKKKGISKIGTSSKHEVYTVSADSDGLTSVSVQFNSRKGNIHSGATPPWLQADIGESSSILEQKMYGPLQEDLNIHLKVKEKSKLNPKRVGANFDHTVENEETDRNWLPSFGRVWNQGARWKSRHEYRKEMKGGDAKKPRMT